MRRPRPLQQVAPGSGQWLVRSSRERGCRAMPGPPRAQACRIGHLDRPYADWPAVVTRVPADAMRLPAHGRIAVGGPANLVLLRARAYSEALARPQTDRACPVPDQDRSGKGGCVLWRHLVHVYVD